MHRVVFFGLDGAFATILLRSLARADLTPVLVVRGLPAGHRTRRPAVRWRPARPSWLDRMGERLRFASSSAPAADDLAAASAALGIDVVDTSDANQRAVVDGIARRAPDALVVAGFEHLLGPRLLEVARCGGLNVHPGQLPRERGPAPLFWALKAGRTRLHWTIHVLDLGEDTGDVVAAGELTIDPGASGLEILAQMAEAAAPQLVRSVRAMISGDLVGHPQPTSPAARRPRPRFADGRLDPSKPARAVFTFAAGCAGRYSLFVEVAQDRFFVRRAVSYDPGAELEYDFVLTGDRLLLRCTPGVVELELKPNGALFSAEY